MNFSLTQTAIVWRSAGLDAFGQPVFASPIEVPVRWESRIQAFRHSDGTERIGNCEVFTTAEMEVDDRMFLGNLNQFALKFLPLTSTEAQGLEDAAGDLGFTVQELKDQLAMPELIENFPYSWLLPIMAPSVRTIGVAGASPLVGGNIVLYNYIGE